jgi:hypothetical protein
MSEIFPDERSGYLVNVVQFWKDPVLVFWETPQRAEKGLADCYP